MPKIKLDTFFSENKLVDCLDSDCHSCPEPEIPSFVRVSAALRLWGIDSSNTQLFTPTMHIEFFDGDRFKVEVGYGRTGIFRHPYLSSGMITNEDVRIDLVTFFGGYGKITPIEKLTLDLSLGLEFYSIQNRTSSELQVPLGIELESNYQVVDKVDFISTSKYTSTIRAF